MVFDKLKGMMPKKEETSEEYMEITEDSMRADGKINVRIETLVDYNDTDRIQQLVREGNVVFLRITELRVKDIAELKRSVDKLRKTCTAMNGDMVGVDEDFLVITPHFAQIYRGRTG
jgi:SepF-like predicted cell division protein (DUF552 family)